MIKSWMSVRIKDREDRAQNLISLILCTLVGLVTIHIKSRFIWPDIVSFQRNLILTVNGIFRRNNLENCQLSRSY